MEILPKWEEVEVPVYIKNPAPWFGSFSWFYTTLKGETLISNRVGFCLIVSLQLFHILEEELEQSYIMKSGLVARLRSYRSLKEISSATSFSRMASWKQLVRAVMRCSGEA